MISNISWQDKGIWGGCASSFSGMKGRSKKGGSRVRGSQQKAQKQAEQSF